MANEKFKIPHNFKQEYLAGQKQIVAEYVDENFTAVVNGLNDTRELVDNIFVEDKQAGNKEIKDKAISPYTLSLLASKVVTANLTTTWTANLQTIEVEGLLAEANFLIDIADNATQAQREAWSELQVFKHAQSAGSVQLISYKPNKIDIAIKFIFGGLL